MVQCAFAIADVGVPLSHQSEKQSLLREVYRADYKRLSVLAKPKPIGTREQLFGVALRYLLSVRQFQGWVTLGVVDSDCAKFPHLNEVSGRR